MNKLFGSIEANLKTELPTEALHSHVRGRYPSLDHFELLLTPHFNEPPEQLSSNATSLKVIGHDQGKLSRVSIDVPNQATNTNDLTRSITILQAFGH
jgi:hypothetical protein